LNAPRRTPRRRLDGVLFLDKPQGLSSNQALQRVRRLYNAEKAGHTGTLDPLATGLLPLCFGEATKFSASLLDADKRYVATMRMGITTETADAEGAVTGQYPVTVTAADVAQTMTEFLGESLQLPPMYSALKRNGKPLYDYARQGIEIERTPRRITITDLQLLRWMEDSFVFEVACSKGTYVRTLAADLGERLGCGGHLTALRRTAIGRFDLRQAHELQHIEELDETARDALLLPVDTLLADLPQLILNTHDAQRICQGQAIAKTADARHLVRLYDSGTAKFIGLGCLENGLLKPQRLLQQ